MYINDNGTYIEKDLMVLLPSNRSFKYGDGFFESIRAMHYKPLLLELHYQRIQNAANALKMQLPSDFDLDYLEQNGSQLLLRNQTANARIRLMFYREGEGLYTPTSNKANFLMETIPLSNDCYEWNEQGLHIGIFTDIPKVGSSISSYKTNNCLPYIMAAIYKNENHWDDCLLLNQDQHIADAISSNVFAIKEQTVVVPPSSDGGVEGVMRQQILNLLKQKNYSIQERSIHQDELSSFDELFLTNAIKGIQWVEWCELKRYTNEVSRSIYEELLKSVLE